MSSGFRFQRVLPPAGGYPTAPDLFNAWCAIRQTQNSPPAALAAALTAATGAGSAQFFSSGTASLYQLFSSLTKHTPRRTIAMGAYTCPDIAAAAVRAGFFVLPLEINPRTLEVELQQVDRAGFGDVAAVVLANLYGLPDRIQPWVELARDAGFLVIDDACQGLLSTRGNAHVGLAPDAIGVLSFGRGKAVQGLGGGAVIWPRELRGVAAELQADLSRVVPDTSSSISWAEKTWAKILLAALRRLERPTWYAVPANIPWLGLGKTEYREQFSVGGATSVQLFAALAQLQSFSETTRRWTSAASKWYEALNAVAVVQPVAERAVDASWTVAPIRYPLLFPSSAVRDRVYRELTRFGLGASLSYPAELARFRELVPHLRPSKTPGAGQVAGTILTVPVHRSVSEADISQAVDIIKGVCQC